MGIKFDRGELDKVPVAKVIEGVRFREDYGDLAELKQSITDKGLFHPPCVRAEDNGMYTLIAGGRRLRSIQELGWEEMPVRVFPSSLAESELRSIELAENFVRKDMTWIEKNNLTAEIHRLMVSVHGEALPGLDNSERWSMQNTADLLGVSQAKISDSLSMAKKVATFPALFADGSVKTESDAKKMLTKLEETLVRQELAKRHAAKATVESSSISDAVINCYNIGDCIKGMGAQPDGSFDLAIVDPPYGIDLNDVKDGTTDAYHEVPFADYPQFTREVLTEVYRCLKDDSYCVYWFGIQWLHTIHTIALDVGFTGARIPMIWTKKAGQSNNPNIVLANCYETALVFRKGNPVLTKPGRSNIFDFAPEQSKYHPTQKPLDLCQAVIETFSFENTNVLVPFAGSGVDLLAAKLSSRTAIGWDLSEEFKGGFIQSVKATFNEE